MSRRQRCAIYGLQTAMGGIAFVAGPLTVAIDVELLAVDSPEQAELSEYRF